MDNIMNNIDCCVLILDKDVRLRAFNDALKTIFSNRKDEDLLYVRCGEAIGCAFQIEEQKECGHTTKCKFCELRVAALTSLAKNETVYQQRITKPFMDYDNVKVDKHLQFSTRQFHFDNEKYIILIIKDVTSFVEKEAEYERKLRAFQEKYGEMV